jgi:TPR repeat protein
MLMPRRKKAQSLNLWTTLALLMCVTGVWAQSSVDPPAKGEGIKPSIMAKARAGNTDAEFYIGVLYEEGKGVPQDYVQAAAWYRKAADQGNANAQFALGAHYRRGQGVPQDYTQAAFWWRKAAEQGDADAQEELGEAYIKGQGVPQDYTQAAFWWRKAAEQGDADAQIGLGVLYNRGLGVPQDYAEAYFWLDIATAGKLDPAAAKTDVFVDLLAAGGLDSTTMKEDLIEYRDETASHLTPADLSRVQERARRWFEDHPAKPH